ncbi:MAG TPA: NADP-dependent phosphogluconate dehydrogenase [Geobacterales bacterium]|nr:NADP-dependent phosphogluconate dehydrogenase [Geobacterales bacterium]
METERHEIGMIGLGVMGCNMLLNMADHGFPVAGYDKDPGKVEALQKESAEHDIHSAANIKDFIGLLRRPRAIMMLVPAGPPVDSVIADLLPHLETGDLIIDAGNSYFKDTNLRASNLAAKGIQFLGVGVSGGEEGARHGASIMPGGPEEAYERVRPLLEAVAAKVNGDACVAYLGPGSAGHFVKMVHNGIEYAVMQLLAETYDLMKRGLGLSDDELREVYGTWNQGELNGYLLEITSRIFGKVDERTGKRLIDEILDVAKQKGTGMWTSQSAMELQVPIPTIDLAVAMRDLSVFEKQRETAGEIFHRPIPPFAGDRKAFLDKIGQALHAAMIVVYAQGMAVLAAASDTYKYHLDLETVARIWRGGCIIRAVLLDDIRMAYRNQPGLPNLLLAPELSIKVIAHEEDLRRVVCAAIELGLPAPCFMTALAYLDGYRSAWLPANLIQAQRDYFGAHSYERIDVKGTFHTDWTKG